MGRVIIAFTYLELEEKGNLFFLRPAMLSTNFGNLGIFRNLESEILSHAFSLLNVYIIIQINK